MPPATPTKRHTAVAAVLRFRRPLIVLSHLLMAVASSAGAHLLRFDFAVPAVHWDVFWRTLPWLLAIRALSFYLFRLYEGLWRYVSLSDLERIVGATVSGSVVFGILLRLAFPELPYPRAVLVTDSLLLIIMLGGVRSVRRVAREFGQDRSGKRVLIIGAGDAGELILRDMRGREEYDRVPVGFVDDDRSKVGQAIHGVRVLGTRQDLPALFESTRPDEVLVAMPSAAPGALREVVSSLEPFRVPIRIMPRLRDVVSGRVEVGPVRNLEVGDLLSRPPIGLDSEPIRQLINGRRVLVTGAGGSIGSELCRQLAQYGPSRLVLVERYENSLFELGNDLNLRAPECRYRAVIGDITDSARVEAIFAENRPEVVFHAAAHKHVPLMEINPCEAVKNNVRGTRLVAEAAARHDAAEFVLISTDKAVNPSSVMGATKRIAERLVRGMNGHSATRFVAVRFGNVLGSHGSVTTVFDAQIKRGGPVTVTHPDIRRYFMLIPEAVNLVLHAAAGKDTHFIFALDMGEPVRILDLARNLIQLAGFAPDVEIPIRFVGLRPGEKLYEELAEDGLEVLEPSEMAGVNRVRSVGTPAPLAPSRLAAIESVAAAGDEAELFKLLTELVPTFRPAGLSTIEAGSSPRLIKGGAQHG